MSGSAVAPGATSTSTPVSTAHTSVDVSPDGYSWRPMPMSSWTAVSAVPSDSTSVSHLLSVKPSGVAFMLPDLSITNSTLATTGSAVTSSPPHDPPPSPPEPPLPLSFPPLEPRSFPRSEVLPPLPGMAPVPPASPLPSPQPVVPAMPALSKRMPAPAQPFRILFDRFMRWMLMLFQPPVKRQIPPSQGTSLQQSPDSLQSW